MTLDLRPVDYESPPVVETALGVLFAPIKGWTLFHFGLLWSHFRSRYPKSEIRLPAGAVQIDDINLKLGPEIHLETLPLRSWFLDASGNQLLQVQANAFIRNWRAIEAEQRYIHYTELRPLFVADWQAFQAFVSDEKLSLPNVFQCEVTYINHLVKGREWHTLDDIHGMFEGVNIGMENAILNSVSFGANVEGSDVRMSAVPALRSDGTPILQVTLNVTGKPDGNSEQEILAKLDNCHDILVNTFAAITASDLQMNVWRRIR